MRKIFQKFMMLLVASSLSFVSCQKETALLTETLDVRLSKDQVFKNVLDAAADMGTSLNVETLSNDDNMTELRSIAERINSNTATPQDYDRVEAISGVTYSEFIGTLQRFGLALNELNKKYPELSNMSQTDLSATVTSAIQANPELQNFVSNPDGITQRINGCPLRDLCNLAVTLTRLFAGDAICAAISVATIPIIGGLLCNLILNLGVGILTGICNALPC
jgi:hypothetical protein